MIQIDQIIVLKDPLIKKEQLAVTELTMDEIKEFGETFFAPGFEANVYLSDNSLYVFGKLEENLWESGCTINERDDYQIIQYEGTFEQALDKLLLEVNSRVQYRTEN